MSSRIVVSTTVLAVALMLAHSPISWSCSTKQSDRPATSSILLLTWLEEPVTWETAAELCRSKNPSMRLARFTQRRLDDIQHHLRRSNVTGSEGRWIARSSGDSKTSCPSISVISLGDGGPVWNFNTNEDCSNLFAGIICETIGSVAGLQLKCFGIGSCYYILEA